MQCVISHPNSNPGISFFGSFIQFTLSSLVLHSIPMIIHIIYNCQLEQSHYFSVHDIFLYVTWTRTCQVHLVCGTILLRVTHNCKSSTKPIKVIFSLVQQDPVRVIAYLQYVNDGSPLAHLNLWVHFSKLLVVYCSLMYLL